MTEFLQSYELPPLFDENGRITFDEFDLEWNLKEKQQRDAKNERKRLRKILNYRPPKWKRAKAQRPISLVYFLQHPKDKCIKIGVTTNLEARIAALKSQYKVNAFDVLGTIEGERIDEKVIHKIFSPFEVGYEFFEPVPPIFHFIKHFCHMEAN